MGADWAGEQSLASTPWYVAVPPGSQTGPGYSTAAHCKWKPREMLNCYAHETGNLVERQTHLSLYKMQGV